MKKKILAVALATMMVVSSAVSAFAATSTLSDVECAYASDGTTSWWVNHSAGIEITEGTTTITFHDVNNGTYNWNNFIYVAYTATEAYAGGTSEENPIANTAGYTEYFVCRADNYGWIGDANTADLDTLSAAGVVFTADSTPEDWDAWLAETQSGIDVTLTVTLSGSSLTVKSAAGDAVSTSVITVDSSATTYIALTGELCKLSNITVSTPDSDGETEAADDGETEAADDGETESSTATTTVAATSTQSGDVANFAAIAIVVAAAVAIVVLRKRVTE